MSSFRLCPCAVLFLRVTPVLLGIAVVFFASGAHGACLESITLRGEGKSVMAVRNALLGGGLVLQGEERCRNVIIYVEERAGTWSVRLHRKGRTLSFKADRLADLATWIESLLVPPLAVTIPHAKPVGTAARSPSNKPPPAVKGKPGGVVPVAPPSTQPSESRIFFGSSGAVTAGVELSGALTSRGEGFSGSIEVGHQAARFLWVGVGVGALMVPMQENLEWQRYYMHAAAALTMRFGAFTLSPGLIAGFEVTDVERSGVEGLGAGVPVAVTTRQLYVGGMVRGGYLLTERLEVTLTLGVHFVPVDGSITATQTTGGGTNTGPDFGSELLRREFPVPLVTLYLGLGLRWRFGGGA